MTFNEAWKLIKDKAFPYKNVPLSNEEKMALNKMEWLVNIYEQEREKKDEHLRETAKYNN